MIILNVLSDVFDRVKRLYIGGVIIFSKLIIILAHFVEGTLSIKVIILAISEFKRLIVAVFATLLIVDGINDVVKFI